MNPVDNFHKHLGKLGTVSRYAVPGQKVGLITARRTGFLRGGVQKKTKEKEKMIHI